MQGKMLALVGGVMLLAFAAQSHANLTVVGAGIDIGNDRFNAYQLIYDPDTFLLWFDYTNDKDTWQNQNNWATKMLVIPLRSDQSCCSSTVLKGWRLPHTLPINGSNYDYDWKTDGSSDNGFNMSAPGTAYEGSGASEMAYLYYNSLGNKGCVDIICNPGQGLENTFPFKNLIGSYYYSETEYNGPPGTFEAPAAWAFYFNRGQQSNNTATDRVSDYAIAVLNMFMYYLTYFGNGNTGGTVPIDSMYYFPNGFYAAEPNIGCLVKEGYAFCGWSLNEDCSDASKILTPGGSYQISGQDVDLYACWFDNPFVIGQSKYTSLNNAYYVASSHDIIKSMEVSTDGDSDLDRDIVVTLKGGYDEKYSDQSGMTTLDGSLTISNGEVTIENYIIGINSPFCK